MNRIKIEEDRVFLADQRTERKYVMGKIDQQLTAVEGRRAVRIQREAELRTKEDRRLNDLAQASAPASASLNNGDTSDISDLDEESSAELSDYNPECKSSDSSETQGQTQQKRAIIVTGRTTEKLLAIPKVVQGTAEVKTRMASCLITASEHETSSERSIKYTGKEELGDKKLDYFIGSRSHFFFQILNLDKSFLNLPVEQ
ncbi:hypothetical protein Bpfe_011081 [Biomphalaria pfeifferi]|uniref:Uncharacterized protein n=1 Tax=Biomphalaria pfeifferi TaxID=112525 RepID=A0AAD8BS14_BIOPF|nr:hypothetical protein Bpfe_011081 [Biomphalaria pfeifferi]